MTPVLEALAVAHAKGIAHRDIKPGNLMLPAPDPALAGVQGGRAARNAAPRMRLLDFGIAKVLDDNDGPSSGQTQTGSLMASYSPRYAAPEQSSGTRTGPWTDVHALGLIFTELLIDAPAYRTGDKMELQIQVMQAQRPTPARFGLDVGPWEAVLARALALRPSERYANAEELLAALEADVPEARPIAAVPALPIDVPKVLVDGVQGSTTAPAEVPIPAAAARRPARIGAVVALVALTAVTAVALRNVTTRPAAPPPVAATLRAETAVHAVAPPPPPTPPAAPVAAVAAPPAPAAPTATPPARPTASSRHDGGVRRTASGEPRANRPSATAGRRHNPWE
jgi:hypothetical protein